jgi:hypothetical protein
MALLTTTGFLVVRHAASVQIKNEFPTHKSAEHRLT